MSQYIPEAEFVASDVLGAPPTIAESDLVVMKFGGTSVSTIGHWQTISRLLQNRLAAGLRPVVVVAAIGKVTSELDNIAALAAAGDSAQLLDALGQRHISFANDLGLDGEVLLEKYLQTLDRIVGEIHQTGEIGPRVRAEFLSHGELMAAAIGATFLQQAGLDVFLQDARDILLAEDSAGRSNAQNYLSATCACAADAELARKLQQKAKVVLTQGFIARNRCNETVLLGREGSDTSAAYLAAMLQARRVEIWTDVPGIFTADPRLVPSARRLNELQYEEAQELASSGSKVLHPRCLAPLSTSNIPLFVRSTEAPHIQGTTVSGVATESEPLVKGISIRDNVTLISMESASMRHEAGFLADVFACFARYDVSINLVSTSETNLTVSVDVGTESGANALQSALLDELQKHCTVRLIDNCAAVGLVGRKIRAFLPTLSQALAIFEEERIHLVSQAANDLNFSFVIDHDQVQRLIGKFHASVIRPTAGGPVFGPSWEELFRDEPSMPDTAEPWWLSKRDALLKIGHENLNAYVYDLESIRSAAKDILSLESVDRILYAVKANFNADVIRTLAESGVDFDCVSPGEVRHLQEVLPDLRMDRLLFTPNFAPRAEYEWAFDVGLQVTLDNLYPLRAWPELFTGQKIFIRLDPGTGRGHHEHVKTAGIHSKFGIPRFEIDELLRLLKAANTTVIGIHAHVGSGILDPDNWRSVAAELIKIADRFPQVEVIDLGGGFGVPEKTGDAPFDLKALDDTLRAIKIAHPKFRLWLEPGRYLVAQAGVLLSRVTQTKGKGEMRYIGIGTGMNALIRPALYGAYHEIVNLTRVHETATESVTIVGPICESGDKLGSDRLMPPSVENDVILIANAGAYCRVMSSSYNLRDVPPEISI